MFEPLEQFEIVFNNSNLIELLMTHNNFFSSLCLSFCLFVDHLFYVFGISDWSVSLFRTIGFFLVLFLLVYGCDKGAFIWPQKWQIFIEMIYSFLAGMFKEQVGYRGQKYFPFLASVFLFVLFLNLFGMIPYEGAITSQLVFNLSMSFSILVYLTIVGFQRQGVTFFKLFLPPAGVPKMLHPLIIFIEVISYIARGVSLGVRLFANIMAGHTLLFIFSSFILQVNLLLGLSIFLVIFLVTFLEFFIATLQAYVFFVLVIIYFRDSIEVSH
jgi:ATP synthase subunit 6